MTAAIAPTKPEAIKPLLRPDQAAEAKRDIETAKAKLNHPGIEDKRTAMTQLRRLSAVAAEQIPQPPANAEEEATLHKRADELLTHITNDGMLSAAEMRACPPGAVDQHMAWERRNKSFILEWKNIMLRTRPGERDAANLERYRPRGNRLNMDNAVVQRKDYYGIENVGEPTVVFSDDELVALQALSAEDHARVASMDNTERKGWKKILGAFLKANKPKK